MRLLQCQRRGTKVQRRAMSQRATICQLASQPTNKQLLVGWQAVDGSLPWQLSAISRRGGRLPRSRSSPASRQASSGPGCACHIGQHLVDKVDDGSGRLVWVQLGKEMALVVSRPGSRFPGNEPEDLGFANPFFVILPTLPLASFRVDPAE